jgi:hypothetical protein
MLKGFLKLSPEMQRFKILLLLSCNSKLTAARELGISVRVINEHLKDSEFCAALDELRETPAQMDEEES